MSYTKPGIIGRMVVIPRKLPRVIDIQSMTINGQTIKNQPTSTMPGSLYECA